MAHIELDRISKRFADGTEAVKETSLEIGDGEFFILVGPSGCGKSTLLNIMVGLTAPSSGRVLVDGVDVTGRDTRERNMAMVFQSYAIYPHMTVAENIGFPLKLAGVPRGERERRVEAVAGLLELGELLGRRPAELSGGQRQRVAMGRAMVREPVAFLLDEPLSNLDARLRVQMRDELARLHRRLGTTTVYVTHDQTEAMTLGDRVAVLRDGAVQQVGTPRQLYHAPANLFVAGFMGAPPMNFLPAAVAAGRLALPLGDLPLPPGYDGLDAGRRLVAGIRPEHFHAAGADHAGPVFEVSVERLEWLGAELHLHFEQAVGDFPPLPGSGGDDPLRLVARVSPEVETAAGARLALAVDPDRVVLFDAASGARITPAGSP